MTKHSTIFFFRKESVTVSGVGKLHSLLCNCSKVPLWLWLILLLVNELSTIFNCRPFRHKYLLVLGKWKKKEKYLKNLNLHVINVTFRRPFRQKSCHMRTTKKYLENKCKKYPEFVTHISIYWMKLVHNTNKIVQLQCWRFSLTHELGANLSSF